MPNSFALGLSRCRPIASNCAAVWQRLLLCMLLACAYCLEVPAQSLEAVSPPAQRPKIALVLSGGGARGVAHVGVLKVLDEMRVPVDFVVGTSMGSIVGGAYAGGMTPREMEERIRAVRWDQVLSDQPPRADRSVRSKQLDQLNVYGLEIGFQDGKLAFPAGAIIGQQLEFFLGSLAQGAVNVTSFDQLPIPYRAIATDVEDGSMVVLDHGNLSEAMRASMSVPGLFAPRQIDGRGLVDGGLSRNLPVDVARSLGADVIIAVNVGTPLQRKHELGTLFGVTAQVIGLLTAQNVRESLSELRADDVLIVPELGTFSSLDFPQCADTIAIGERAARGMQERLARFALPEDEYAHFRGAQLLKAEHRLEVQEIQVDTSGLKHVNPEAVRAQIKSRTGERFDPDVVEDDVRALYVTDDFQQVRYRFEDQDGKRVLVIEPVEKSWGPNYLRFGLDLSTDLKGESAFTLGIDHRATWLNRRGLEWRNTVFLGQHTGWISELYQPLDLARTWFVAPGVAFNQESYNLFLDDRAIARYLIRSSEVALQAGRRFGTAGEFRVGYGYSAVHAFPSTAVPGFTDVSVHQAGLILNLVIDQYDSWAFPTSGYTLSARYWGYRDGLGADLDYDKALVEFGYAFGHGRHSLTVSGKYGTALGTTLPDYDGFELGGPLNLSGFQENQLVGTGVKLGRLVYYYRLADGGRFVKAYYVGGSLEAGNVTDRQNGPPRPGLIFGSSAFVGADTVLGPLYFAVGYAEGGNYALYLFLGRR